MIHRRVRKKKATNYCVRFGHSLWSAWISCQRKRLTPCHARREFFRPKLQHFLKFQVYLNVTQWKRMTSLLFLNNFYPVMSYRRSSKGEESDELLYTVRSLVMVRANQLPAQWMTMVRLVLHSRSCVIVNPSVTNFFSRDCQYLSHKVQLIREFVILKPSNQKTLPSSSFFSHKSQLHGNSLMNLIKTF